MLEFDVVNKEYYSVAPSTDYSEAPHGDLPSDSEEVNTENITVIFISVKENNRLRGGKTLKISL